MGENGKKRKMLTRLITTQAAEEKIRQLEAKLYEVSQKPGAVAADSVRSDPKKKERKTK